MGHLAVPWFIGGTTAVHSDKIGRLLGHLAAGGREGVLNPLDCRVRALATPGPAVRVSPGAYAIRLATRPYESYLGMVDEEDVVSTTATGSSGGRSDLVIIIVQNPNDPGENGDIPADEVNGPYVSTEIITGVPSTTTSWRQLGLLGTAIALARIDLPPNTATVTQAMIKDLRSDETKDLVATPPAAASQHKFFARQATSTSTLGPQNTSAITWPAGFSFPLDIPDYATTFSYDIDVKNVRLLNGNVRGRAALKVGSGFTGPNLFDFNWTGSQSSHIVSAGGFYGVAPAIRGTRQTLELQLAMDAGYSGTLAFTEGSFFRMDINFQASSVLV